MNRNQKSVLQGIKSIELALTKAREYLESGKHANWQQFRPLFDRKTIDGKPAPPHKDWVKNVFIPRYERALKRAEKTLKRLDRDVAERAKVKRSVSHNES